MKIKKKMMLIPIVILSLFAIILVFIINGAVSFATFGQKEIDKMAEKVEKLSNNHFYIWHNSSTNDITSDIINGSNSYVFKLCPTGDTNIDKNSFVDHTIWFTSDSDSDIPTLYPGDKLLYVSDESVPYEGITWERYADYGYTIGISNLESDNGGHCYIENPNGKGYKYYVYTSSDADQVNQFTGISTLFLDKVGNNSVTGSSITDGGTVAGLTKDKSYLCEFYTGTYYQDFSLTANVHTFGILEDFTTYDFKFLHSNCIEITIPSWFKTGYYYVDGIGFFRYVTSLDSAIYSGQAYDETVNWNDPIKQYDSNGSLIFDPSTDFDKREQSTTSSTTHTTKSGVASSNKKTSNRTKSTSSTTASKPVSKFEGDVGVGEYENIYNEVKVK